MDDYGSEQDDNWQKNIKFGEGWIRIEKERWTLKQIA